MEINKKDNSKLWKVINSETLVSNRYIKLKKDKCLLPNNHVCEEYYVGERGKGAMVFAVTTENKIIIISQYKHGAGEVVIELPAGLLDDREDPIEVARRELKEETGYTAENFESLGFVKLDASWVKGGCYVVYCNNAKKTYEQHLEPTEEIDVYELGKEEIKKSIIGSVIDNGIMIAGLFLGFERMKKDEKDN